MVPKQPQAAHARDIRNKKRHLRGTPPDKFNTVPPSTFANTQKYIYCGKSGSSSLPNACMHSCSAYNYMRTKCSKNKHHREPVSRGSQHLISRTLDAFVVFLSFCLISNGCTEQILKDTYSETILEAIIDCNNYKTNGFL